jgi:Spy/CpxP family protein refolding chaperone
MNLAVVGAIGFYWSKYRAAHTGPEVRNAGLTRSQALNIRRKWRKALRHDMKDSRKLMATKYSELIDMIASENADRESVKKAMDQIIKIRGDMERKAVMGLKRVLQDLPPENRKAFALFLKRRACFGRGFGRGRRFHGRGPHCPMPGRPH